MQISYMRAKIYSQFVVLDVMCLAILCVCVYRLKDKSLISVHGSGSMLFVPLSHSFALRVFVYGSSLICTDCETDAGVYCHCSLFCIYFVIFPLLFLYYPKIQFFFSLWKFDRYSVYVSVCSRTAANGIYILLRFFSFLFFFFALPHFFSVQIER